MRQNYIEYVLLRQRYVQTGRSQRAFDLVSRLVVFWHQEGYPAVDLCGKI